MGLTEFGQTMIKALMFNVKTKPIFFKSFDPDFAPSRDLLGGFVSAIDIFAKGVTEDQVKAIIMGKMKYFFRTLNEDQGLTLVIIANQEADDAELEGYLEEFKENFLRNYSLQEIESHASEPSYFEEYERIIEPLIQEINPSEVEEAPQKLLSYPVDESPELSLDGVSFHFLNKYMKDELGRILLALFIGMRIVITGEPNLVKIIMDTLEIFAPHRALKKVYWSEELDDVLADLVGVPPLLSNLYIDSTIINLDVKRVEGLKRLEYFDKMARKIQKMRKEKIIPYIREKTSFLLKKLREFVDLINLQTVSNSSIEEFNREIDTETLKVLEIYLFWNYPKCTKRIRSIIERSRTLLLAEQFII
jgi:hypothetical protein